MLESILKSIFSAGTFQQMLRSATPVALAALGGSLTEHAGIMNIGMDGMILMGAFFGVLGSWLFASAAAGVALAVGVGLLVGLFFALFVVKLRSDEFIIGCALNTFALGLTGFLSRSIFGASGTKGNPFLPSLRLPGIESIPFLGKILSGNSLFVYLTLLFVLLLALFVVTTGLCRLSSWLHHDTPGKYAVLVGTAAMPNCGFIGLPLCSALLGTARGTVFAGMAMASYNVWFFTYVVCLFRPGEKIRLKTFITPTNIATVAMLVLLATGWRLPAPVQQFCSAVGGCTTPLALMIVGVLLADSDIRALLHTGFLYRVTLLRGILFPLLFMLLLWLLPLDNVLRTGLSIIACCPAGSLAAVLAKQTGTEATLASQAVAHSTVCMLVTVPAMLLLTGVMFPM